ncbi:efflux RND transporter periplasmic adaptor subunit [uncultured Cohaesibacter sp.]|uniref:efflux RND transporter periplasmic adaptor subunit n=1 Tax=uncultured Cohaesibacter sp. TaxID=1002546 RepID=UPI00292DE858|nr:efflux RND transporter periplasmic adaptor subunit [uncultured Cohaesibacter sp.]
MKHVFSLLVAILLIFGVYLYQFGIPFGLGGLLSGDPPQSQTTRGASAPDGAGGGPGGGSFGRRGASMATYVTLTDVVFTPYEDTFSSIGTGVAKQSVSLVSEVSGQIKAVHVEGTPLVGKDDILIELDSTSERINVEIAEANLSQAKDTLERYSTLQTRNSGAVTASNMKEAESAVAVAQGQLALAQNELEDRTITSPINGKLGLSEWEVGDFISNGTTIVEINNTETILVTFELPERAIYLLEPGREVYVTTPAINGKIFNGKIIAFDSTIDETTRTVTVKAEIDNKDGRLWPGMTFEVLLRQKTEPLASVPAMSLTWTRDGTQIWIAEKGKVRAVPVIFRYRQDDTIWIEGDLKEGMKVVVEGVQKLRPGAPITSSGSEQQDARTDGGTGKPSKANENAAGAEATK